MINTQEGASVSYDSFFMVNNLDNWVLSESNLDEMKSVDCSSRGYIRDFTFETGEWPNVIFIMISFDQEVKMLLLN